MGTTVETQGVDDGYSKYRGKCKEMCDALVGRKKHLKMVRGHYYCPIWGGDSPHWWCVDSEGRIHDPTSEQFPSKGSGIYVEFSGFVDCVSCGKTIREDEIDGHSTGSRIYCSYDCFGEDVM